MALLAISDWWSARSGYWGHDLELASGIVEGAVRYVVSQRFDEGGMRWIPERAKALLQPGCIEINGEWEQFISFVHKRIRRRQSQSRRLLRLRQSSPDPLPSC